MDEATLRKLYSFFLQEQQPSEIRFQSSNCSSQPEIAAAEKQVGNKQIQQEKPFAQGYYPYVGVIQSIWFHKKSTISRIQKYLYGTGFLIRPTIVITCTHNVFDTRQKRRADKVTFIPGQNGYNISKEIVYQCNHFKYLPMEQPVSLDLYPTINDLCILRLEKQIKLLYEIPMQVCKPNHHQNLTMIAYPNKGYRQNAHNLLSICLDRRHVSGKMKAIKEDIISYKIATESGCSGSPIFARRSNKLYLVGMHSHNGGNNNKYNEGLYFNSRTWTVLINTKQLSEKMYINLTQYNLWIKNTKQVSEKININLTQYNLWIKNTKQLSEKMQWEAKQININLIYNNLTHIMSLNRLMLLDHAESA